FLLFAINFPKSPRNIWILLENFIKFLIKNKESCGHNINRTQVNMIIFECVYNKKAPEKRLLKFYF
ncbi:MAG: hypothetical protein CR989_02600, partial [Flavobacteriales bacterium]